ncbi:MAG: hypothetical protein Q9166_002415 [cf. Caloplaca sp. 2 TL-2023]
MLLANAFRTSQILFAAFLVRTVTALPQTIDQTAACKEPGGPNGVNSRCWELLGLTDYTKAWWTANSTRCAAETGFSTCFLQVHNLGLSDCTGIKPNSCPDPIVGGYTPQDWYILYNIYTINQVLYSLYTAIGNANTLASESVGAIVELLNPPEQNNLLEKNLFGALTIGLALLPGAGGIAGTLIRTAQQLPSVGTLLFPVGTTDTRVSQWASLANELSIIVQQYQKSVSEIIPTVNNDVNHFVAFASTGNFSINPLPDMSDQSDYLLRGLLCQFPYRLTTFIIGKALEANNIHLNRAVNVDVHEIQTTQAGSLAFDTGCGDGYDDKGICANYWFDSANKITYTLDDYKNMAKSYHDQMEKMFGNWTTGDLLFGGAARCAAAGGIKDGDLVNTIINAQNPNYVAVDCISSAQICTFTALTDELNPQEFIDCPKQPETTIKGITMTSPPPASPNAFPFKKLPPELRQNVLSWAMPGRDPLTSRIRRDKATKQDFDHTTLFRLSQLVSKEALAVFEKEVYVDITFSPDWIRF